MAIYAVTNGPQDFIFCERDRRLKSDGEQGSSHHFCMGQLGKASHTIRQGLQNNNSAGRTWEHQKQEWPVCK